MGRTAALGFEIGAVSRLSRRPSLFSPNEQAAVDQRRLSIHRESHHTVGPFIASSNKDGVGFSHFQLGETFNSPYKRIRKDWFFHNPSKCRILWSRSRCTGGCDNKSGIRFWKIKRGLLPDFVEILIRLPFFLDLIEYHRVGAVKERLFVENLREIAIPVLTRRSNLRSLIAGTLRKPKSQQLAKGWISIGSRSMPVSLRTWD